VGERRQKLYERLRRPPSASNGALTGSRQRFATLKTVSAADRSASPLAAEGACV